MPLFRTIIFVAAVAGAVAGFALTALQHLSTIPLIRQAETYEVKPAPTQDATEAHHQDSWPGDGLERIIYTALANIVGAVGLGLLLVALSEIAGGITHWRQGLFWGLSGFIAFTLAPSLSLPPELPGMPSADLASRQVWWAATAALTAGGTRDHRIPAGALGGHSRHCPHRGAAPRRRAAAAGEFRERCTSRLGATFRHQRVGYEFSVLGAARGLHWLHALPHDHQRIV